MMNPQTLRSMMQMQQAMGGGGGGMPGFSPPGAGGTGMDFGSLLGSMQGANFGAPGGAGGAAANRPPEERYRVQLQSLRDMGFDDDAANIRILEQNHGNVNRCIDLLLSQPMPAAPAPAAPAPPAETANSDASGSADTDEAEKNEESKKND